MGYLFDDFGSHGVDEAGRRPVQDDEADGAERFKEDGRLRVCLAVSVTRPTVPLLLCCVVVRQNLMHHTPLIVLKPVKAEKGVKMSREVFQVEDTHHDNSG